MSWHQTTRLFLGLATVLLLVSNGCEPGDPGPVYGEQSAALGNGASNACKGLLQAWENVCPDLPSCPVIEDQLAKHGCFVDPPAVCPCTPDTWNYYPEFNGVYCFAPVDYGRLSVCSPEGQEICVSNYGTAGAFDVDGAICAACREEFPVSAWYVFAGYYVTVFGCGDVSNGMVQE